MTLPKPHHPSVSSSNPRRYKSGADTMSWRILLFAALLVITLLATRQIITTTQCPKSSSTPPPTTIESESPEHPKPTVAVLSTGGTILGKGNSPTDTSHYVSGASHIDSIIDSIRQDFEDFADVVTHEIFSTDSINIGTREYSTIRNHVLPYVNNPRIKGIVWITGSTTMTTQARIAQHTIWLNKTMVMVAALKPLTAYGADGLGNILSAIRTAAICDIRQPLMLLDDKIALARGTYKQNNVFVPGDGSLLGRVVDSLPEIYHEPRESPKTFDIEGLKVDELPKVRYFHPMMEEEEFEAAIVKGVKGANLGVYDDGYWPDRLMPGLQKLLDKDDVVVAAVSYGYSLMSDKELTESCLRGSGTPSASL